MYQNLTTEHLCIHREIHE